MMKKITSLAFIFTLAAISLLGLSKTSLAAEQYNPQINPVDFSAKIDNPYFTLIPGATFVYKNKVEDGIETNKMVVTNLTREVMGVKTLVVWDRVWLNNNLVEETYDWYAQDKAGNVWYFGEESREYENGKVSSTHGSWESGIDGAKPGIIMKANPQVGDSYRQEYYQGEAEDMSDILALNESIATLYGSFKNCLKTKDWTPLEPDLVENKYFCSEVGQMVVTINIATGKKDELVDVQKNSDFIASANTENIDNKNEDIDKKGVREQEDEDRNWFKDNDDKRDAENGKEDNKKSDQEEGEELPLAVGIGIGGLLAGLLIGRYKDIFSLLRKKQVSSSKKDGE